MYENNNENIQICTLNTEVFLIDLAQFNAKKRMFLIKTCVFF